jgi:hypothetical protein
MTSILSITNPSQLAEFCAVIIPCIWAGSFKRSILSPKRHAAFKLYVQKVLKATQISCTCLLLALYYIQRLRTAYPSIPASTGSEVRLFTTALVLANKYLDDNTFTNKTWSDVSNISVHELNIMEMEFLSALDYNIHIPHTLYFMWTTQCQQWWSNTQLMQPIIVNTPPVQPTTTTTTSLKRSFEYTSNDNYHKKRCNHTVEPVTPPSIDYYPNYYPINTQNVCKPILSWSSSVSALASATTQQSTNTTAAKSNIMNRVRCLEIE